MMLGFKYMHTNLVRTTISLPQHLHQSLRLEAIRHRVSLGEVIIQKIHHQPSLATDLDEDKALFAKIAKSGRQIDLVHALRQERNRDDA